MAIILTERGEKARFTSSVTPCLGISLTCVVTSWRARKEEAEQKGKNYLRREMSYGAMQRTFALPAEVDADKAEATFRDGVLRLKLPKAVRSNAKQIKVT